MSKWTPITKWLAGFATAVIVPLVIYVLSFGAGLFDMSWGQFGSMIFGEAAVLASVYLKGDKPPEGSE